MAGSRGSCPGGRAATCCALLAAAAMAAGCAPVPGPLPSPVSAVPSASAVASSGQPSTASGAPAGSASGSGSPAGSPAASSTPAGSPTASATPTASAAEGGCPPKPWTLASLAQAPERPLNPAAWPSAPPSRAQCFGRETVRFDAIGGGAMFKLPGVVMPPALGTTYLWFTLDKAKPGGPDFMALLGRAQLGTAERDALERTWDPTPGVGWAAGTWWRVAGHLDDPASSECRSSGEWDLSDGGTDTLLDYTTPQAVTMCREVFVIESLEWLPTAPAG